MNSCSFNQCPFVTNGECDVPPCNGCVIKDKSDTTAENSGSKVTQTLENNS